MGKPGRKIIIFFQAGTILAGFVNDRDFIFGYFKIFDYFVFRKLGNSNDMPAAFC